LLNVVRSANSHLASSTQHPGGLAPQLYVYHLHHMPMLIWVSPLHTSNYALWIVVRKQDGCYSCCFTFTECFDLCFWFYLFKDVSQYKFEFQAFLKFCDVAGSKFRSIAKRLCDWEGSHAAHENVSSIHQQFKCISFCILGRYLSMPGTFLRSMLVPFNG